MEGLESAQLRDGVLAALQNRAGSGLRRAAGRIV